MAQLQFTQFIEDLREIVGERNVISHPDDLLVYEYDGSIDRGMPRVVVLPDSGQEVSRVMARAYQEGDTRRRERLRDRPERRRNLATGRDADFLLQDEPDFAG